MEYRIIYNNIEVISAVEHSETTYTRTAQKVFIGTIVDAISFFRKEGVNYTYLINEYDIVEQELFVVNISDLVLENIPYSRTIVVLDLPIDFTSKKARGTFKIKVDKIDIEDVIRTFVITNDTLINESMGEFDYFYEMVMNQGIPLPTAISGKILEMDSRQVFDN